MPLEITIPVDIVQKLIFWATIVGTLGATAQALLQKWYWSPRVKAVLSVVLAIVLGLSSFLLSGTWNGTFADLDDLVAFILGAYGAIQIAYGRLKEPVLDQLEKNAGVGAHETPKGTPEDPEDHDGYRSRVPDPYGR